MKKTFIEAKYGQRPSITVDGVKYEIAVQEYVSNSGYAPVIIINAETEERYQSYGSIDINGHTFITKWGVDYDYNRLNYVGSHDLIVEVL
jgi:hypothetical protein